MLTRDEDSKSTFGVIVLAAGKSSRMGRPKQLLPVLGRTLVEHTAQVALNSGAEEVLVVLGAESERVKESLSGSSVKTVANPNWEAGMGGSISAGIVQLSDSVETVVIVLGDQPLITPAHLCKLASAANPIAATSYCGILGAPCAFTRSEFPELRALDGDQGARDLIRDRNPSIVPFDAANCDIDTIEDYRSFIEHLGP